jgi:hypothetical protein
MKNDEDDTSNLGHKILASPLGAPTWWLVGLRCSITMVEFPLMRVFVNMINFVFLILFFLF